MLLDLNNDKVAIAIIAVILIIILFAFSFWAYQSGYNKGLKTKQSITDKYQSSPITNQTDKTTNLKFDDSKNEIDIDLEGEEAAFGDMRTYGQKSNTEQSNNGPDTIDGYEIAIPEEFFP